MKMLFSSLRTSDYRDKSTRALFRLCTALLLYICFGLLTEYAYAGTTIPDIETPAQGAVWLIPEDGIRTDALLLATDVSIHVSGMIARATVTQRFRNTSSDWAEGIYVFPLPDNAAVDHFRLHAGGRIFEGQIQDRANARQQYQSARNEGKRASLVEQQRANVFRTSLANIAPGEEISIEIEYQQTLDYKDGDYRLRFPMVVGPRYHAATLSVSPDNGDTDVSTLLSDTKNNPVNLQVTLDAGVALEKLDSTYHAIDIRQTETYRYSIALSQGQAYADRDFELVWRPQLGHQPQAHVFSEEHNGHQYALLSILPPDLQSLGQILLPREVIFILDVSGSMSGTSIKQARASLIQALSRLKPEDRFNIIWFNDRTERMYPQAVPATREATIQASAVISSLSADGGTVMLPALTLALSEQPELSHVRQIVFLTDGNVDNERELFGLINRQLDENRLFTIGIGSAPNSYFMRKAAELGRGSFTYIGDLREVQPRIASLLTKLE
ncbi:MAG: VWA domain-containing protein, partial [Gammaproteobacteria bacterium]|nr:VWA domain-containing protein [Gammaproteobacteria bacterium]